ncbi:MAG: FkbM family methyltransferase [Pseudohongiellaceae bacterium]|nr:FkbM family methyltransferase [Pseudohongiellaceae bacterium]
MSLKLQLCRTIWDKQWLKPRQSRAIYKCLSKAGQAPDFPFTQDFYGLHYEGNLRNNIDFHIFYYGAFEKPLLHFLRDTLQALDSHNSVFVDIGANIGQHALFMSTLCRQVHAFEPFDKVRQRLDLQITNNKINNIQIHTIGVSNENASLPFYAPTGANQGIGSFDSNTAAKGNVSIGELALVKGDDYFPEHGIDRIDIMKIDVEGFEKPALQGLQETLNATRPIIVVEVTYGEAHSFSSIAQIASHLPQNYELFTFDNRKVDGSKARKRDGKSRISGNYDLVPYTKVLQRGQDNIIACPREKLFAINNVKSQGNKRQE